MEGERNTIQPMLAREEETVPTRVGGVIEESYGSSRFLPHEEGASVENSLVAGQDSLDSRRQLLSCSVVGTKGKKKRKSRASCKAPIQVFSTDISNFMATVHKLTGISSNVDPFQSTLPPPWNPKILPFNQALPTLDTSTFLLQASFCHPLLNGINFPGMQALVSQQQQQLNSACLDVKSAGQAGQPSSSLGCTPLCSIVDSQNFPSIWESSCTSQNSTTHQQQQNPEDILTHKLPHKEVTINNNIPSSSVFSGLETFL
ncbi:hypothetical protein KP509_15G042200 [Ceratopteris richardii]|uniref:VQ domain-containing protein n=1 Tax=Ceratopteris richardii TaxID=49495 RepID=A0A8T2T6G0_CERRI|nr:hypothetical protein KP509_15G042200 [Ceratopteris richardii]KAH7404778.1 hypothetical protein KP509_15G042200 [Ceratopteris richardii]